MTGIIVIIRIPLQGKIKSKQHVAFSIYILGPEGESVTTTTKESTYTLMTLSP